MENHSQKSISDGSIFNQNYAKEIGNLALLFVLKFIGWSKEKVLSVVLSRGRMIEKKLKSWMSSLWEREHLDKYLVGWDLLTNPARKNKKINFGKRKTLLRKSLNFDWKNVFVYSMETEEKHCESDLEGNFCRSINFTSSLSFRNENSRSNDECYWEVKLNSNDKKFCGENRLRNLIVLKRIWREKLDWEMRKALKLELRDKKLFQWKSTRISNVFLWVAFGQWNKQFYSRMLSGREFWLETLI